MCDEKQHHETLLALEKIHALLERREPLYKTVTASDVSSFVIDYQDRDYLFVWSGTALTFTAPAIGSFNVPAEEWYPLIFRPGTQFVTSGQADGVQIILLATDSQFVPSAPATAATATLSSVAAANTATTLLASNPGRRGAYFYNDSSAVLYLALTAKANVSTTNYTLQIGAQGYYELPAPVYTGEVSGVWATATGNVRITEES